MAEVAITATALLCAVLLIRGLLRERLPLGARYALWGLVLLRLLVPVTFFQSPASVMNAVSRPPAAAVREAVPVRAYGGETGGGTGAAAPAEPAERPAAGQAPAASAPEGAGVLPAGEAETERVHHAPEREPVPWSRLLPGVWCAGAALMGGWFLWTNLRFYGRLRRGRRDLGCGAGDGAADCRIPQVGEPRGGTLRVEGARVYRADFLPSSCLAGLFRPAVYLDAYALRDEAAFRHVLTHELCHRRHGDNLWALLRCLCLVLWWFHPLVWAAAVLSKRDCELFCDEAAVKRLGEAERLPYGRTLVSMVAQRRPGAGDLLCATTSMTEGKKQIKERVIRVTGKRKTTKAALALGLTLALLAGICTFTGAVEQSVLSPLPYRVTADAALAVEELEVTAVSIPDFPWSGSARAYVREVLIRWMAAYGQQFYALPEGAPWRAADVQVVYNPFKGKGLGPMGDPDWTPDPSDEGYAPDQQYIPNSWVTLAVKPAGGIDAVRPLFHGGVPRGTGEFADYVLLQYHVSLEKVDGRWVDRGGDCVTPAWNTTPPPDREDWTGEQIGQWNENLSVEVSPMVEGDTPDAWREAGAEWADHFTSQFLRFYNTGHPGMSDDVKVLAMDLQGGEPSDTPQSLFFHLKFAFRPIWGVENGAAFLQNYCEGPGGSYGYAGHLPERGGKGHMERA